MRAVHARHDRILEHGRPPDVQHLAQRLSSAAGRDLLEDAVQGLVPDRAGTAVQDQRGKAEVRTGISKGRKGSLPSFLISCYGFPHLNSIPFLS